MTNTYEKAAGVLDTPEAASLTQHTSSLSVFIEKPKYCPSGKALATAKAHFALHGRALTRSHRANDGWVTYVVSHLGQSRHLSHWHDVLAHLAAIGGRA